MVREYSQVPDSLKPLSATLHSIRRGRPRHHLNLNTTQSAGANPGPGPGPGPGPSSFEGSAYEYYSTQGGGAYCGREVSEVNTRFCGARPITFIPWTAGKSHLHGYLADFLLEVPMQASLVSQLFDAVKLWGAPRSNEY